MARKNGKSAIGSFRFEYLGILLAAMQPVVQAVAEAWVSTTGGQVPSIPRKPGGKVDLEQPDTAMWMAVNGGANVACIGPFASNGDPQAFDRHFRAELTKHGMTVANINGRPAVGAAKGNFAIFLKNLAKKHPQEHAELIAGTGAAPKAKKARKPKAPKVTAPAGDQSTSTRESGEPTEQLTGGDAEAATTAE
jgi:hypothetical protein